MQLSSLKAWSSASAFLLTHPLRGVTSLQSMDSSKRTFLLTHPLWGATFFMHSDKINLNISTHTPLAGCNTICFTFPTVGSISTHTPLVGCNHIVRIMHPNLFNFYSHTPCGVQLFPSKSLYSSNKFLLTHPLWGATEKIINYGMFLKFLLTHPLRGATS